MNGLAAGHVLASLSLTAGPAANGILVLVAMVAFVIAAFVAWFIQPRAIWGTLVALGLALFMLALLVGS